MIIKMSQNSNQNATHYNLYVTKICRSYSVRLPKKFVDSFGINKGDLFTAKVTGFGAIEIQPKSQAIDTDTLPTFDLKATVNGNGLIFILGNDNLVKIGWFPKQDVILSVDLNGCLTLTAECGTAKPYLTPNIDAMSEDDLHFSYKLLQERIEYLAEKGDGLDTMDIFTVSSGVKLLDKLHMAWSRLFDLRLKEMSKP